MLERRVPEELVLLVSQDYLPLSGLELFFLKESAHSCILLYSTLT